MTKQSEERIREDIQTFKRFQVGIYEGIIHPSLQAGRERKERFIRVCCVCKRWDDGDRWSDRPIPVGKQTHTYCPKCADEFLAKLDETDRR